MTVLLRRTIRNHLWRPRPDKILTVFVFQQIHLRFFRACGLAFGRTSFASSGRQCRTGFRRDNRMIVARTIHEYLLRRPILSQQGGCRSVS